MIINEFISLQLIIYHIYYVYYILYMYNYLLFTSISMLYAHKCEQTVKKNIIFYYCILLYFCRGSLMFQRYLLGRSKVNAA